jgi:N-formylglutamate deformylase
VASRVEDAAASSELKGDLSKVQGNDVRVMSHDPTSARPAWTVCEAPGPVVATAIHGGHDLRRDVARHIALSENVRLLEEDLYTAEWASIGDSSVVVHRSRFELDLNRPREQAVYLKPGDAWGLQVWRHPLPARVIEESRALHDRFYQELYELLERVQRDWGRFVVLDLHSYNHRRDGPGQPPADPAENPDVNVGTGSLDRRRWSRLVDRFIDDLRAHEIGDRPLDVRENVRFEGAYLVRWVNSTFAGAACALAIEVKKVFMDEYMGVIDPVSWKKIHRALEAAAAGSRQELRS